LVALNDAVTPAPPPTAPNGHTPNGELADGGANGNGERH
jgi:hypothetical protein